jgi:NAD(P)-dependent dehydrogenase (short-subunit alcohol dehydrogenase family)
MTVDGIRFDHRVAVVTGAGRGLGREHALLLASLGAAVVVNDIGGAVDGTGSSRQPAESVVAEIEAAGGIAVADTHSVATPEGGAAIIGTAIDTFGRVDVVVNNAGISRAKTFANMGIDQWDDVIAVHLRGAVCVTLPAWRSMRAQGYGRIVNTSSAVGLFGAFGLSNYGAAKMGLIGLTRVLAQEGAKYNIHVNAIAPVARTRMSDDLLGGADEFDPVLVSPVVAWLAHEDCPANGEIISAGAGRVARVFVAETPGYVNRAMTAADVRDHWADICAEEGYQVPAGMVDAVRPAPAPPPTGGRRR